MPELATPALVIDAATVERNLSRLAAYTAEHRLGLRPHTKTHKSKRLAAMQMAAGAIGLTTAKVGEAEVMTEVADDILLAFPAVDPARTDRLARLALSRSIRVAIDSATAAAALGEAARSTGSTLGILVELDVGLGRTGVQTAREALELAQAIDRTPGLRLDGLMFFPGHIMPTPLPPGEAASAARPRRGGERSEPGEGGSEFGRTPKHPLTPSPSPAEGRGEPEVFQQLRALAARLAETLDLWRQSGLAAKIVSGGSTPTAYHSHLVPGLTEIRPGTYIFNDMNTVRAGCAALADCAARVVATVVSTAVPDQFVIDAGSKTLTSDRCAPAPDSGHGLVVEYPDAKIARLSEEHAQIDARLCPTRPKVGDRVTVIPNHICPCVNLQDQAWWRNPDGNLEAIAIDARGRSS